MKRFLTGTLANIVVVLLGHVFIGAVLTPQPAADGDPLGRHLVTSGLIGGAGIAAALLHVRVSYDPRRGPTTTVIGACAVTTLTNAVLSGPALPQFTDAVLSMVMIATAGTGALLGACLGVLRRQARDRSPET